MRTEDRLATRSLGLLGIDHLEFWVGNARAVAGFFASAFGFEIAGYLGPETGRRDRVSYFLKQGDIRWVVSGALGPESPIADHVRQHGDGVHDVALTVPDARAAYELATARGAEGVLPPTVFDDEKGRVVRASIATYGDTLHSFVQRDGYGGIFLPGFQLPRQTNPEGPRVGLKVIDHVVGNVPSMHEWVSFYERVMGFSQLVHFDDEQISTEYSALMSIVVEDDKHKIVLPINEPATGKRKSQIEEYLEFYRGAGVQHIAMRTDDIISAVRALSSRGVRFLRVPKTYYEDARVRLGGIDLPWNDLAELGILVDRDHDGHLLQIFTENITDRPTVFFEIIQREGSRGFGVGNFKALFEAIEREQAQRGNL